jgi:hypothetical protein
MLPVRRQCWNPLVMSLARLLLPTMPPNDEAHVARRGPLRTCIAN